MALIALEGMRFYAYHGFYQEERIIGSEYIIDIHIDANTQMAAATDDLYKTVNYETIYLICQAEMRKSTQLLEALAQRIESKINNIFGRKIKGLKIRIRKMHPPLGGRVDASFVEIDKLSSNQKSGGGRGGFGGAFGGDGGFGGGGFGGGGFNDMDFGGGDPIPDFGGGDYEEEEFDEEEFDEEEFDEEEFEQEEELEEELDISNIKKFLAMNTPELDDMDDMDMSDMDDIDMDDIDMGDMDDIDLSGINFDDLDLEGFEFDEK